MDLPGRRLEAWETALVGRLMDEVRTEATKLELGAEVLATRRDVEAIVLGQPDAAVLHGWRRGAIGERLLALATAAGVQAPPAARRNPRRPARRDPRHRRP